MLNKNREQDLRRCFRFEKRKNEMRGLFQSQNREISEKVEHFVSNKRRKTCFKGWLRDNFSLDNLIGSREKGLIDLRIN